VTLTQNRLLSIVIGLMCSRGGAEAGRTNHSERKSRPRLDTSTFLSIIASRLSAFAWNPCLSPDNDAKVSQNPSIQRLLNVLGELFSNSSNFRLCHARVPSFGLAMPLSSRIHDAPCDGVCPDENLCRWPAIAINYSRVRRSSSSRCENGVESETALLDARAFVPAGRLIIAQQFHCWENKPNGISVPGRLKSCFRPHVQSSLRDSPVSLPFRPSDEEIVRLLWCHLSRSYDDRKHRFPA